MSMDATLKGIVGDRLRHDEPMATRVNFRIGGRADRFVTVETADETAAVVTALHAAKSPYFIMGGGSNVLVADQGYRGTVVQIALRKHAIDGEQVTADAGVLSAFLARQTVEAGLEGFEWAIGLPGTVGGAVRGNAGCFGGETKDTVTSVDVLAFKEGSSKVKRETWDAERCAFGYRDSAFKHLSPPPVILSVTLALHARDTAGAKKKMEQILKSRKEEQPLGSSSAGCIFKNIALTGDENLKKLWQDANIPPQFLSQGMLPASWIVEQADLKGFRIGDAQVSERHGNFCVNAGHATAEQVVELIAVVKTRIRQKYGLRLQEIGRASCRERVCQYV